METDDVDAPHIRRLTCDNPSPMTLEGTHTYVVGHPEAAEAVIVDPGPEGHREHMQDVFEALGGRAVAEILVTHRHRDHTGAAKTFSARTGAPVRGLEPGQCLPGGQGTVLPLQDGELISVGGTTLTVLHTPGHTSDSVCLWIPEAAASSWGTAQKASPSAPHEQIQADSQSQADADPSPVLMPDAVQNIPPHPEPGAGFMLTGDTILGRGTTMLEFPDGTLTDYLSSLERLATLGDVTVLPAHGPARPGLRERAEQYIVHRQERLDQVRGLLGKHGRELTAEQLGTLLYGDRSTVPEGIITKIAAAQLEHLGHLGEL